MYKGVGVRFADLISFFLKYPMKIETKLFHFHRIFKNRGQEGGSIEPPEPPLDPPLLGLASISVVTMILISLCRWAD